MNVEIELEAGMRFVAAGQDGLTVRLDAEEQHGGLGMGFRPMELLLVGLGSCTAMDVLSILRKKRQEITAYRIEVRGDQATDYPHVFTQIYLRHILTGRKLSESAAQRAIELSEGKYCPAYAMLSKAAPISTELQLQEAE